MADMIAMLDGLGAYGENPVGDVNTKTQQMSMPPGTGPEAPTVYAPQPYMLGAADVPPEGNEKSGFMGLWWAGWLGIVAVGFIGFALWQKFMRGGRPMGELESAEAGFPVPEMVEFDAAPRRARRKGRGRRRRSR